MKTTQEFFLQQISLTILFVYVICMCVTDRQSFYILYTDPIHNENIYFSHHNIVIFGTFDEIALR